jgi:Yip1 domain
MTAEPEGKPRLPRFSLEEARARLREAVSKSEHLFSRAWGLVTSPKAEWEQIRAEETTIPNILVGYVAPLAAILPVANLLAQTWDVGFASLGGRIIAAIVGWVVGVAMVYLLGLIINATAENFDSLRDELAAQKLAAYSLTPFFLSTLVIVVWPPLFWVTFFPLAFMVFLIYRGLPILMRTREDRAPAYTATVTIVAMVTLILQMAIQGCITPTEPIKPLDPTPIVRSVEPPPVDGTPKN